MKKIIAIIAILAIAILAVIFGLKGCNKEDNSQITDNGTGTTEQLVQISDDIETRAEELSEYSDMTESEIRNVLGQELTEEQKETADTILNEASVAEIADGSELTYNEEIGLYTYEDVTGTTQTIARPDNTSKSKEELNAEYNSMLNALQDGSLVYSADDLEKEGIEVSDALREETDRQKEEEAKEFENKDTISSPNDLIIDPSTIIDSTQDNNNNNNNNNNASENTNNSHEILDSIKSGDYEKELSNNTSNNGFISADDWVNGNTEGVLDLSEGWDVLADPSKQPTMYGG